MAVKAQTKTELILNQIRQAIQDAAAGGATEATQLALLAELTKDFDFEIKCVRDTVTDVVYIMRIQKDETDGAITVDYIDATGAVVVPPANPLVVCDTSAVLNLILAEVTGVQRTFNLIRAVAAGSIPAGTITGSVFNAGTTDGVLAGAAIKPGESIPIPALGKNETYGAIAYTASATAELIIQYSN